MLSTQMIIQVSRRTIIGTEKHCHSAAEHALLPNIQLI